MTRRSRCPPLHSRGGHVFFGFLLVLLAEAAVRLPAQDDPYRDYFLLGFGWGGILPLTAGFSTGAALEDIESGPLLDDLVRAILIRRTVADRLVIDIDHDAERLAEGELFGGNNIYSLLWQGREGEGHQESHRPGHSVSRPQVCGVYQNAASSLAPGQRPFHMNHFAPNG